MENKYYTPSIEELFVGFQYEALIEIARSSIDIKIDWVTSIFDSGDKVDNLIKGSAYWNSVSVLCETQEIINKGNIRVKYLDKEDIESLGFVFVGGQMIEYGRKDFTKKGDFDYTLTFIPNSKKCFNVTITAFMVYANGENKEWNMFQGTVKNKSELKKILQMLNIQ